MLPLETTKRTHRTRSVQYVHWVMHKCIMVKLGGNEKHVNYVKKPVDFTKSGEI